MASAWGGSFGGSWGNSFGSIVGGPTLVVVPNVVLSAQASGITSLESNAFAVAIAVAYSDIVQAGLIISQSPVAGSLRPAGTLVTITVSAGSVEPASGPYTYFNPELAEMLEDAFERAGISPQNVGQEHLASALRSIRFQLFSEWPQNQLQHWLIRTYTQPLTPGIGTYLMPAGSIDVVNMTFVRQGVRTVIERTTRTDMTYLAAPATRGRPDRFWVDRQYRSNTIGLWLIPDQINDSLTYDYITLAANVGDMSAPLELPAIMQDAFITGLAMRLAQKFNIERYDMLRNEYGGPRYPERIGGKLQQAKWADRERADATMTFHRPRRY